MTTTQPTEFRNPYGGSMRVMQNGLAFYDMEDKPFLFDSPEQAHRAALPILTGPGEVRTPGDTYLWHSVVDLETHFKVLDRERAEKAAAEAEAAELEAEARHLHRALAPHVLWGSLDCSGRKNWIDVAREARRLHTNKETQHG